MKRFSEAERYSENGPATEMAPANFFAPANRYASVDAMLAAVNPVVNNVTTCNGVFERFAENAEDKPIRVTLSATIKGNAAETFLEKAYLVSGSELDGKQGVKLTPLYDTVVWTAGANAVAAAQGGRTGHKDVSAVSVNDLGLAAARTGSASVRAFNAEPAELGISDIGEALGILRLAKAGTAAAGGMFTRMRWR